MPEHSYNNQKTLEENETHFLIITALHKSPNLTQRELSLRLNISLGKINYLLKELAQKGIIKVMNFSHRPAKLNKVRYILTKKGLEEKLHLTYHFLKRKEDEYNRMKKEWEELSLDRKAEPSLDINKSYLYKDKVEIGGYK